MPKIKSLKPFIPAYTFAALILVGSSIPTDSLDQLQRQSPILEILLSDFVIHFAAFGLLALLLGFGYIKAKKLRLWWAKAASLSLFVGLLVEAIQFFIPYRDFSIRDLVVDILGIVTVLVPYAVLNMEYFRTRDKETAMR